MIYDIAVLGLGAMGSATCYELAKRGVKTIGIEQFGAAHDHGSSHGESRIIRKAYFEHPDYIPLLNRSYELWRNLENDSQSSLLHEVGLLSFGDSSMSELIQGTLKSAKLYSIPIEQLSSIESQKRFPSFRPAKNHTCIFEPNAGYVKAEESILAFSKVAQKMGANLRYHTKILHSSITKNEICIQTDQGEIRTRKLILTGGGWNRALLKELPFQLQLRRMLLYWYDCRESSFLHTKNPCYVFQLEDDIYYGFPSLDGQSIKVAAHVAHDPIETPEEKSISKIPSAKQSALESWLQSSLPSVSKKLLRFHTCIYTMTKDSNFVIDQYPAHSNVWFAAGFSGHGFKFAPVIGEILADLSTQGSTALPIDFLRLRNGI